MPKKFKAKKTFSCRFADGQVKKIIGYNYNEQTKQSSLWIRTNPFMKRELTIPKSAIIGLGQSEFIMGGGKFCFCCHTFDSEGNPIKQGNDDLTKMTNELINMENDNKFLHDQINTLQYQINEQLRTREGITEQLAGELSKILDSTVSRVKTRYVQASEYPVPVGSIRDEENG